jgi:formylglycine-generating enzyme required for sulfatase activity
MQLRVFKADKDLYEALSDYFDKINYLQDNPPKIKYTQDTLEVINDSLYRLKPNANQCAGGVLVTDPNDGESMIPYEQVVNYKNDGNILLESDLFNKLSETAKAALVFHEAIYKYRRDTAGDTNSIATRRIVGLIFSTLSTDDLKKALADLGESETGAVGMKFVPIQPGSFEMGSSSSEVGRFDDETQHLVILSHGFEMQTTDVTQAQYAEVMGVNPSAFQKPKNCPRTFKTALISGQNIAMCPNNPVENVSYNDAQIFISKLNSAHQDGHYYRLPSEAEWEYTARAGSTTAYSFGNDPNLLFQYGWFSGNSASQTHEVAQLKPNAFGLYDMQGNVWQWVADWFGDYGTNQAGDPSGPADGSGRVFRGGGWDGDARGLRSAVRLHGPTVFRFSSLGFRLVRTQ